MLRRFGFVTLLLLGAMLVAGALGQPGVSFANTETAAAARTLEVTGRGLVMTKHDTATISLGFNSVQENAVSAFNTMAGSMNDVAVALKQMGIKDEQIMTGTLSLQPEYEWLKEGGQVLKGYRAINTVSITTQELNRIAEIIQVAIGAGANQLNGISFAVKDGDELIEQAIDMAVDDAKAKADRVAKRLGTEVVGVVRVSIQDEGRSMVKSESVGRADAGPAAMMAPVYSGTGEVRATVSFTFELKKPLRHIVMHAPCSDNVAARGISLAVKGHRAAAPDTGAVGF